MASSNCLKQPSFPAFKIIIKKQDLSNLKFYENSGEFAETINVC